MRDKRVKVAVVGSRDFVSQALVERVVYLLPKNVIVVSGGARGVDSWAEHTVKHWRNALWDVEIYPANWKKHGKSAGYIRNNDIVRAADIVVAFWDGKSSGTKHTIQLAKYLKKPYIIVEAS